MTDPHHHGHHHHHPGSVHPAAPLQHSILRLSAVQRLALAAGLVAVLWLAVLWAMR